MCSAYFSVHLVQDGASCAKYIHPTLVMHTRGGMHQGVLEVIVATMHAHGGVEVQIINAHTLGPIYYDVQPHLDSCLI